MHPNTDALTVSLQLKGKNNKIKFEPDNSQLEIKTNKTYLTKSNFWYLSPHTEEIPLKPPTHQHGTLPAP